MTLRRSGRPPAFIAALALLAAAALGMALYGRLRPVSVEALEARARLLHDEAAVAFEADARTLRRVAARIQRDSEFSSIVDGGGAEVRPARLFSILSQAIPSGDGWGAIFFDGSRRAVAWSGDAPEIAPPPGSPSPGLDALFHVTRFYLMVRSPRGEPAERHGVLFVTRRYPTGILRPDLVEFLGLSGGPTTLRLRARAAARPDRLLALSVEKGRDDEYSEDVARARARWAAAAAAVALLALGFRARAPVTAIAAARLALLLGSPRAGSGFWAEAFGHEVAFGLVSTPADVLLTGLLALVVLRILVRRFPGSGETGAKPAALLVAIVAAPLPFVLARAAAFARPELFDSLDLLPETAAGYAMQTGAVALAAALIGAAALALRIPSRRRGRLATAGAVLALGGSLSAAGSAGAFPLAAAGSILAAAALSGRLAGFFARDLLGRSATAVFLVAAACAAGAAGVADGKLCRMDAELERAERAEEARAGDSVERSRAAWEKRLKDPGLEPWLPAGDRTDVADLSRALWVRGATGDFPATGDLLRLFDARGKIVSSFGVLRPGTDMNATTVAASAPVPLEADWVHVPYPRESERDPLLLAAVSRDLPERTIVERLEYDAAGRPKGVGGTDRIELPRELVAKARKDGVAAGRVETAGGARRVRVKLAPAGFTGFAAPGEPPFLSLGVAVAAGEASLALLLPLLLLSRRGRAASGRAAAGRARFFGTFRARLVTLVLVFGALPLAGSIVVVRVALDRHAALETARRARSLLDEARRSLESSATGLLGPTELNRAAAVIGSDLFLYRDGTLEFASRTVPVAGEVAPRRLTSSVAEALAEGKSDATAPASRHFAGAPRVVEAAETISRDGRDALAVVLAEDEAARTATDALVLFTVGVALLAFGLGGRAALALGKPIEDLIEGTEKLGSGVSATPIERPENVDLARLVEAFEAMAARVRERTESLAQERAAAVGLLSNLTAAVVLFRLEDGAVVLANPAADRILPGGMLGERVGRPGWERLRQAIEEARRRPSPYETRVAVPDGGRERVFRCVVAALASEGSESRSILVLEDLTDFVRADRLTAWVDAARAVAHDVKNPLTPIRLAAERLMRFGARGESPPPGATEEAGANILRQVAILTERIGRLARFSDPSALEKTRLDASAVAALLEDVASDFSAHEWVRVRVSADAGLAPVEADRTLLRDVLTNLVVNAIEAIGSRPGMVRLLVSNAPLAGGRPGVRFACEDDGPGVPAEATSRLFEPAFSTKSRGSGMGLAAVRRAVERHGGSVFAERREGGGLVIGFTLPGISSGTPSSGGN